MDPITLEFSIPADDDGYILLQCGHCGEYFKLTAEDCENDDILRIVCPVCGLESETYLTDDVIQLALTMADNYAMDLVNNMFKDLERKSRHNMNIPWWRSHPIHENRATESICTEPCNPLLRATKSMKRATSTY